VVCGCNDNTIRVLDVERKRLIAKVAGHADDINAVAFVNSSVVLSGTWAAGGVGTEAGSVPPMASHAFPLPPPHPYPPCQVRMTPW
jgi:hypothetical protein